MGTGYTRNDTSNNIANGNVIAADDLDGEFNAIESAFNESTGHTHDGTSAEGAPIEVTGPNQEYVSDATALYPKTDDTYDLGKTGAEWKDLYVDGTANIDSLVADTADINGGTIDGVTLGTNSAVTEAQVDNINIDGNAITSTNTDGNIALTPNGTGEVDISKVDIDSGTIDGTVIGGTTPAAISGTTGQFDTSLNVDGTITSDGLTVDGDIEITDISPSIYFGESDTTDLNTRIWSNVGKFEVQTRDDGNSGIAKTRLSIDHSTGDISFYEDTGTTPKFFWDASAESLGIGTSSPDNLLTVQTGTYANAYVPVSNIKYNANDVLTFGFTGSGGSIRTGTIDTGTYGFSVNTGGGSEAMRIDSSGNVGIGTSSPSELLEVSSTSASTAIEVTAGQQSVTTGESKIVLRALNAGSGVTYPTSEVASLSTGPGDTNLIFRTTTNSSGAQEAMRIDQSGNLLVGTTSLPSGAADGLAIRSDGTITVSRGSTATINHVFFRNPNGLVGTIQTSGSSTLYNTSSDYRLKENITDAQNASAVIDGIQVRQFDWKADGEHQRYGMIAQELDTVAPEAVTKGETEDDMWAVDYSKLVPMLVKEIQDLRKRVAELEQ